MAMTEYFVEGKFWNRNWYGNIGRMKPNDIHDTCAMAAIDEDGAAHVELPDGRSYDIAPKKQNWYYRDAREVTRRTYLNHIAKHKAARRAALIVRYSEDWRKPINMGDYAPLSSEEKASLDAVRIEQFRRAKPKPQQAYTFAKSVNFPTDLSDKYADIFASEERRYVQIKADLATQKMELNAQHASMRAAMETQAAFVAAQKADTAVA